MKFLIDGMLGKLSRWLRIIGYDTKYLNDAVDDELIRIALSEKRILLTSDIELYRVAASRGAETFLIKGRTNFEKLAYLARRFNIDLKIDEMRSRCPVCGSRMELVTKREIEDRVPEKTLKTYERFWVCLDKNCRKIYWHGSHWKKIDEVLKKANVLKDSLKKKCE